ncbi:MAG: hypothetical protein GEV03_21225 [Streptosporangiales bacterium]|nr:hypothetical protein [Streptosporangiales bacterium]
MSREFSLAEFGNASPELAEAGRRLLYQFGVGLAFLGTVRPDGGPRLHPICPLLSGEELLAFIHPSPKRDDLGRDGRYAMHSFPCPENEDAFYVSGHAVPVTDDARRRAAAAQFLSERGLTSAPEGFETERLYEFFVERCLWTVTSGHGDWDPRHNVWRAE